VAVERSLNNQSQGRAGRWIRHPSGYRAFHPAELPPDPAIDIGSIADLLSKADLGIGRLDAATGFIPNPDLFVGMYVRKEAVLSSQIEGTQASLNNVLEFEAGVRDRDTEKVRDVEEVISYVRALNHGLARLGDPPVSLRLIREIHAELMRGVRGEDKQPGEFRRSQNWIGPGGCTLENAVFVPPPPEQLMDSLGNLESYIRSDDRAPVLVRCGVAHAHFETIHPFLDGNGRLGRLLITLMLCERGLLRQPLLYLSSYFKKHQQAYYDWLMRVRLDGDWEGWLRFFLTAVEEVAEEASETARGVLALQREHREMVIRKEPRNATLPVLLEVLLRKPVLDVNDAAKQLGSTYQTANSAIARLEELGLLREITGRKRGRVYRYQPYLDVLTPP